mmetsp:Transcript_4889/g.10043  ORF Transcript_4889/g.10043 Transcript_4889/m.10043 type:complete len:216 (+) Transcript_4889:301-948(+)
MQQEKSYDSHNNRIHNVYGCLLPCLVSCRIYTQLLSVRMDGRGGRHGIECRAANETTAPGLDPLSIPVRCFLESDNDDTDKQQQQHQVSVSSQTTAIWYLRQLQFASWLTLCQFHLVAMTLGMMCVSGVWRIVYTVDDDNEDIADNEPVAVAILVGAISTACVLRIHLWDHASAVQWIMTGRFGVLLVGLFTHVSYQTNLPNDFGWDPHDSQHDE